METFSRKTGIIGALALAGVLIGGAYLVSDSAAFFKPNITNAESTQAILQAYAQKDSDGDGLPDWEESLYGTDSHNAHSVNASLTDGQAVAQGLIKPKFSGSVPATASSTAFATIPGITAASGSLTDQFAQSLFGQVISQSNGTEPSEADIANYAQKAIQDLVQNHAHQDTYLLMNEKVSGSGPDALTTYAIAVERAIEANKVSMDKGEVDYFSAAVNSNDQQALVSLKQIGNFYVAEGRGIMAISVPQEAQHAHLELANSLTRVGSDITDMSTFNTDPLRSYLGLAAYQNDSQSMAQAFADIASVFNSENITIQATQSGYNFYKTAENALKTTPK